MPIRRTALAAAGLALFLAVPAAVRAAESGGEPAPEPAAEPASGPHPPAALGITYDSKRLDIFDPATGNVISSASAGSGWFLDADYSSVRGEIFFVVAKDGHDMIMQAPLFGSGTSALVAYGRGVAVSPDGRFLAYAYDPDGPEKGSQMQGVALRDLDTGAERRFPGPPLPPGIPPDMDDPAIDTLALSPDSTRLAFNYFDAGDVFVVDLVSGRSLADARLIDLDGARSPAWRSDDTLAVVSLDGSVRTVDPVTGAGDSLVVDGWPEKLNADDAGRLVIKLDRSSEDDGTTYVMVDTNGEVTRRWAKPYHTVVW